MNTKNDDINVFDLPDDEAMAMSAPPASAATPTNEPPASEPAGEEAPPAGADGNDTPSPAAEQGEPEGQAPAQPAAATPEGEPAQAVDQANTSAAPETRPEATDKGDEPATPAAPTPEDHAAFYQRILGQPIKANGKEIRLRSPEEAERLIQMGLNYTKKMQALQPRMRVVTMLENNGLLDEAKLNHLIDVAKGDPLAIQKLLADVQFDPMSIDADKAASYKPNNHQVSDAELQFNAVLDELESSDTGVELITQVAKQWDEQSRRAVYQNPEILLRIHEQKANGLFDVITAEMEHLRMLGKLNGIPFLQAYKAVGDMLYDQGRLVPAAQTAPATPVATRVATPAPKVTNNERAAAASPTKATPAPVKTEVNYLDLPDEEFLKQMDGRL